MKELFPSGRARTPLRAAARLGLRSLPALLLLAIFNFAILICNFPAPAAVVRHYIMDQTGTNVYRTSVRFQSLTNPQISGTNWYGLRDFTVSNTNAPLDVPLHAGRWRTFVGALSWVTAVPETNGLILATDWPDVTVSNTPPGTIAAGTNVVIYITNGVYVINATGTGGGGSPAYTNNTDRAGLITGAGIGTNLNSRIASSAGAGTNTTLYTSTDAPEHTFLTTPSGNYQLRVSDIDFGWYFTGGVSADGFYGDGSGLTALDLNNFGAGSRITLTNMIADWDARWWFEPHDHNLSLTNLQQRYRTGKTLRIANYGDNAFDPYTLGAVPNVLAQFLSNLGTIGGSGGLYYSDTSASVTQNSGFGYGTIPFILYGMPNNTGMTNRTAFYCDTVTLQYVRSNGFGTITVMTNDGSSGAWGVVAVVDANNGGNIAGGVTNFTIAAGTRKAAAWSSGTNLIQYCGNYWSSNPTNFVWDPFQAGTIDLLTAATNTAWLDCTTKWLSQYDVVIFNESSQSNQAIMGYVPFAAAMRTNAPTTDLIFLQPPPITNAVDLSLGSRLAYGKLGADYGLPIMDLGSQFFPLNPTKLSLYYNSDGVHLSLAGNRLAGWRLANFLLQPFVRPEALNASLLTTGTVPMGRVSSGTNEYAGPFLTQSNGVARYWSYNAGVFSNLNASELRSGTIPLSRLPSGVLSNNYTLPVVLNDSLSLSNGNLGVTNYSGTTTIYMSSPNGGGLGSLSFNGAYQFSGAFGLQANQFVGSGAGLTALPANQLTGTIDTARLDGTKVMTNGNVTDFTGYTNPAAASALAIRLRGATGLEVIGSGVSSTISSNRVAVSNASGFGVLDATGKLSVSGSTTFNSGEFGTFGLQSYAVNNAWLSDNGFYDGSAFKARAAGHVMFLYFLGGTGFELYGTSASATAGQTVLPVCRFKVLPDGSWGLGGSIIHNNAAMTGALLQQDTSGNLTVGGYTVSTNGFRLLTNGVTANLVAGRFYSTNGASAVTFGAFASVPTDSLTRTTITVSNTTAATPFQVIFPGGTRATNGVPATFDVQGSTEAIFEVYHNAQRSTNVVRVF